MQAIAGYSDYVKKTNSLYRLVRNAIISVNIENVFCLPLSLRVPESSLRCRHGVNGMHCVTVCLVCPTEYDNTLLVGMQRVSCVLVGEVARYTVTHLRPPVYRYTRWYPPVSQTVKRELTCVRFKYFINGKLTFYLYNGAITRFSNKIRKFHI